MRTGKTTGRMLSLLSSSRGIITRMRSIDIHAHWYPAEWLEVFEKDGAREGASLERVPGGGYRLRVGNITNAFDERFIDLESRMEKMSERRIDLHALSLTTPMV